MTETKDSGGRRGDRFPLAPVGAGLVVLSLGMDWVVTGDGREIPGWRIGADQIRNGGVETLILLSIALVVGGAALRWRQRWLLAAAATVAAVAALMTLAFGGLVHTDRADPWVNPGAGIGTAALGLATFALGLVLTAGPAGGRGPRKARWSALAGAAMIAGGLCLPWTHNEVGAPVPGYLVAFFGWFVMLFLLPVAMVAGVWPAARGGVRLVAGVAGLAPIAAVVVVAALNSNSRRPSGGLSDMTYVEASLGIGLLFTAAGLALEIASGLLIWRRPTTAPAPAGDQATTPPAGGGAPGG